jgi:hypothetical protein
MRSAAFSNFAATRGSAAFVLLGCTLFAAAGVASRILFPQIETRDQIVGFWIAGLGLQFVALAASGGKNRATFLFSAVAATLAIIATKFAIEGLPAGLLSAAALRI